MDSKLKNPDAAALLLLGSALIVELVAQMQADQTLLGQLPPWVGVALFWAAAAGRLYLTTRRARLAAEGNSDAIAQGLVAAGTGVAIGRAVAMALTEAQEDGVPEAEIDTESGEVLR